jgi:hypothetical protein
MKRVKNPLAVELAGRVRQQAIAADITHIVYLLVCDLERAGFGTDSDVSGADLVDLVSEYYAKLRPLVKPPKDIPRTRAKGFAP